MRDGVAAETRPELVGEAVPVPGARRRGAAGARGERTLLAGLASGLSERCHTGQPQSRPGGKSATTPQSPARGRTPTRGPAAALCGGYFANLVQRANWRSRPSPALLGGFAHIPCRGRHLLTSSFCGGGHPADFLGTRQGLSATVRVGSGRGFCGAPVAAETLRKGGAASPRRACRWGGGVGRSWRCEGPASPASVCKL